MTSRDDPALTVESSVPDMMNDPAFDSRTGDEPKPSDEPDTCRICRGEGTKEEPLFYPCKCSGSIKFVHQECLMEWLSHSQKKHCELCKTPFRFTKLYHPQMPQTLPTSVFIRKALVHVIRHFLTWCRGLLVGLVWLVVLPYCVRVFWRGIFWVGDGGWALDESTRAAMMSREGLRNGTASRPLGMSYASRNASLPGNVNGTLTGRLSYLSPIFILAQTVSSAFQVRNGDVAAGLHQNTTISQSTSSAPFVDRHPSLLSEVTFLKSLSVSTQVYNIILDILEGQIIALLVVVAFILVFLIREWVVQQQPVINLAGDAERARNQAPPNLRPVAVGNFRDERRRLDGVDPDAEEYAEDMPGLEVGENADPLLRDAVRAVGDEQPNSSRDEAVKRAHELLDSLPTELRQAMRRGNLEEVLETIDQMPQEEAQRMRQQVSEWGKKSRRPIDRINRELDNTSDAGPSSTAATDGSGSWDWNDDQASPALNEWDDSRGSSAPDPRPITTIFDERNVNTTHTPDSEEEHDANQDPDVPDSWEDIPDSPVLRPITTGPQPTSTPRLDDPPASTSAPEPSTSEGQHLNESEQASDGSNESWQHLSDIDDKVADSAKRKGKAKAEDPFVIPEEQDDNASNRERASSKESSAYSRSLGEAQHPENGREASLPPSLDDQMAPMSHTLQPTANEQNQLGSEAGQADTVAAAQEPRVPQGLLDTVLDYVWGDVAPANAGETELVENDEHVVRDIADEAPFVRFGERQPAEVIEQEDAEDAQEGEADNAAAAAGLGLDDADAVDDAEDLEGILELIGMAGPLVALVQNLIFSMILISAAVTLAVWLPYLWGKVVILFLGNPLSMLIRFPLQIAAKTADIILDFGLWLSASAVYWSVTAARVLLSPLNALAASGKSFDAITVPARSAALSATLRMKAIVIAAGSSIDADQLHLSVKSHVALRSLQSEFSDWVNISGRTICWLFQSMTSLRTDHVYGFLPLIARFEKSASAFLVPKIRECVSLLSALKLSDIAALLSSAKSLSITIDSTPHSPPIDPALHQWTGTDRVVAVLAGYSFFAVAGALYLSYGAPFSTSQQGRKIEGFLIDVLQQAGGVLKVILIISIEMLVFPLYCGLLLDVALMPLFGNATFASRWAFSMSSPKTSIFVHWFIGTCYMFHFALFVSMCRKIMRSGVLYFIRDPDDPTFHPVRDVLERNVTTQLRKITFSAMVYGGLVIVCLGGVVWGLYYATEGILPVYWVSNQPAVEFPLDILFYNFLAPLLLRVLKPSVLLNTMYEWWFRKCARGLRLSNFLFGDKKRDEEGHHVRRTWTAWLTCKRGIVEAPVIGEDRQRAIEEKGIDVYFLYDGKFVRAPASDQVRIPKGAPVFVEVDCKNNRLDGLSEDQGVHSRNLAMTTKVYIPPWFRIRIGLFVLAIWIFAASTGLGVTVVPLLFGRKILSYVSPEGVRMNDVYAFSLGLYMLGGLSYFLLRSRKIASFIRSATSRDYGTTFLTTLTSVKNYTARVLSIVYVYTALAIMLPLLFAILTEMYILIPLHAYTGPGETHYIHVIQDWTLGFMYARIGARLVLWDRASRPARALRAVVRDGYLDPNAWLATRCFVLPILAIFSILLTVPLLTGAAVNKIWFGEADDETTAQVFRMAYPAILGMCGSIWMGFEVIRATGRWRQRIRDEVYLIGERLHNFGEKKPPPPPSPKLDGNDGTSLAEMSPELPESEADPDHLGMNEGQGTGAVEASESSSEWRDF